MVAWPCAIYSAGIHGAIADAINWQVVNIDDRPDASLPAPILLITGSLDPKFSAGQLADLRAFVESGGILFS